MGMRSRIRLDLISNGTVTGNAFIWRGGRGHFAAAGTFGGSTVKLQFLGPDGSTWIDAGTYTTLTSSGGGNFDLPECQIRASISGGSPSGIFAVAVGVDL